MHRHFMRHGGHRGRHSWGGHMGRHGEHGRGGGRIGRFFGHGDLRVVVLALLEEQPRHGYELIKELEARTGGAYRPSPGVVYPTLALLEDEGAIRPADGDTGRKLYGITEQGRAELESVRGEVEAIRARMEDAFRHATPNRPRLDRAMANLGMALRNRMSQPITPEDLDRIVSLIDETAAAVERS